MAMMRKAQRRKAKLRLGISGPAGGGKTYGSLLVAYGITGDWEKICLIDTENHSGELYANYNKDGVEIGEYNYIEITSPFTPDKYIAAIKECEAAGIECIIIDSFTHAWAGEGGLLDKKGQIEKKTGNGWTAWRDITPQHNRLVESVLQSKCHIIATLRAKMDYVQEKDPVTGKTVIRKVGLNPVQRDGMEYEFTMFVDVDQDHNATTSKDRTSILDGKLFKLSVDIGKQLLQWLESGVDEPVPVPAQQPMSFIDAQQQIAQDKAQEKAQERAKQQNGNGLKWDTFWANVKVFGLNEDQVHLLASEIYQKQVVSLTDVITTQAELNRFTSELRKHAQKAG